MNKPHLRFPLNRYAYMKFPFSEIYCCKVSKSI